MKTVKVSLTLPEDLLMQIKSMTDNVSAFVTEGIRQYVAKERLRRALELSAGSWDEKNHPELITMEAVEEVRRWHPFHLETVEVAAII